MLTCEVEGKEFVAKDHSGENYPILIILLVQQQIQYLEDVLLLFH